MIDIAVFDALEGKDRPKRSVGKRVKGGRLESPIQREIVKALRRMGFIVHHSPNGAPLGGDEIARAKQAAVLKADGRIEGWPDLVVINRQWQHGYLEVKRPGGTVSADQDRVAAAMLRRGGLVAFVCSLDEALAALRQWGWL